MTTNEEQTSLGAMDHQHISLEVVEIETVVAVQLVEQEVKPYEELMIKCKNDWIHHLAQALTFSLLVALGPIAILQLSIFGVFLGGLNSQMQNTLSYQLGTIIPPPLSAPVSQVLTSASDKFANTSGILVVSTLVFALVFVSRLFTLLEVCFDVIFHLPPRPFVRKNLVAIGMLFLFVVLTPIIVVASTAPTFALSLLHVTPLHPIASSSSPSNDLVLRLTSIASSLIFSLILFSTIYVIVPYRHISPRTIVLHIRNSLRWTLVAAVAMHLCLQLFPIYAANSLNSYIGQAGFVLLLLGFFYLIALILLLGAEVNAFFAEGIRIPRSDLITQASKGDYR